MKKIALALLLLLQIFQPISQSAEAVTNKSLSFKAEVWADNWFALYINGKKVGEDSVSIKTERSFNSEIINFKATYPLTIGFIAKDFVENASGLEYIGKPNQQIGDAGIAFQIHESDSGKLVTYSQSTWKVLVIDKAPLNPECVSSTNPLQECKHKNISIPKSWASSTYKDSSWKPATVFSKEEVGVKDGYFDITWDSSVQLVWSSDLRLDNTILLRKVIQNSGPVTKSMHISSPDFTDGGAFPKEFTCDGSGVSPSLSWSNVPINAKSLTVIMDSIPGPARPGEDVLGNHYYLIIYNIPTNVSILKSGSVDIGILGQNFQGKVRGYTPPCSQGPGDKIYTIYLYALNDILDILPSEASEQKVLAAMKEKIITVAQMSVHYART